MAERRFDKPKVRLNRIYTKKGDGGMTRLAGGQEVAKDDARLECYGTVDEVNSLVGMAALTAAELSVREPRLEPLAKQLRRVQHELFNLGSALATKPENPRTKQPRVTDAEVARLEREIDEANEVLDTLRSFVLPGGSRLNVELHVCRTVCRRAERLAVGLVRAGEAPAEAVRYLNRLSDAFFVWSRWVNAVLGVEEILWEPEGDGQ